MKSCIGVGKIISILLIMVGIMFNATRRSTLLAAQQKITLPAGTRLVVMPKSTLNSGKSETGHRIAVTLAADHSVNGVVVARRGNTIFGRVTEAKKAGRVVRKASLVIELTDLVVTEGTMYPIKTHPFGIEGGESGEIKKIIRRATIGGIIGGADIAKRMVKTGPRSTWPGRWCAPPRKPPAGRTRNRGSERNRETGEVTGGSSAGGCAASAGSR